MILREHHDRGPPTEMPRVEPRRECLALPARQLALHPSLPLLRESRRALLQRLESPCRLPLENHLYRHGETGHTGSDQWDAVLIRLLWPLAHGWRGLVVSVIAAPSGAGHCRASGRRILEEGVQNNAVLRSGSSQALVRLLLWDGQGLCLSAKLLERGRYMWPVKPRASPPVQCSVY